MYVCWNKKELGGGKTKTTTIITVITVITTTIIIIEIELKSQIDFPNELQTLWKVL